VLAAEITVDTNALVSTVWHRAAELLREQAAQESGPVGERLVQIAAVLEEEADGV
jgi:hypothetical protein